MMCTQAIDTAHSLETGKGLRIQNQPKGIQSHQPYIDSRQIGVYIHLGHDRGILFGTYLKHYIPNSDQINVDVLYL